MYGCEARGLHRADLYVDVQATVGGAIASMAQQSIDDPML